MIKEVKTEQIFWNDTREKLEEVGKVVTLCSYVVNEPEISYAVLNLILSEDRLKFASITWELLWEEKINVFLSKYTKSVIYT